MTPGRAGRRGGSYYDDPDVFERYTRHYDVCGVSPFSPNYVMEEPAVLAEVGDPTGRRVLDLGCGDAGLGQQLLAAGAASYGGIDGSHNMVQRARERLDGTTGHVELGDLEEFTAPADSADIVICRLAMHYVQDINPVLAAVSRCLAPGGRFVMTVVHPVITSYDNRPDGPRTAWTVDDYFESGPRRRDWFGREVIWYHRTIEQYVGAFTGAGLSVTGLRECEPVAERFAEEYDELARRRRVPLFLLLSSCR